MSMYDEEPILPGPGDEPEPPMTIWVPPCVERQMENPEPVPAVFEWRGTMTILTEEFTPFFEQPDGQWIPYPMSFGHPGLHVGYQIEGEIKPVGVVNEGGEITYYDQDQGRP